MHPLFYSDALRLDRDPRGSTWLTVRGHDWVRAMLWSESTLRFDGSREVLELGGRPLAEARGRLPREVVVDREGTRYVSDPERHRVLRQRVCDPELVPLAGIGGRGSALDELQHPRGLAIDPCGGLWIADSGNHRVTLVELGEPVRVIDALGVRDEWGRFVAGQSGGAMVEPVDVAVDSNRIYVADRSGGRIHVFDRSHRYCFSFEPRPVDDDAGGDRPARPLAIVVEPDGNLLILDELWPRLLRSTPEGVALAELDPRYAADPRFAKLALHQRFAARGAVVLGPFDGGTHGVAWHRVVVDLLAPAGTRVGVQTFACDDPDELAAIDWASFDKWGPIPEQRVWMPTRDELATVAGPETAELARLVLSGPVRADDCPDPTEDDCPNRLGSDRGRYLWIRLELEGARLRPTDSHAIATPTLAGLRLLLPRQVGLELLPPVFARRDQLDPPGALFLERLLALFETRLTALESAYEDLSRLLDLDAKPLRWQGVDGRIHDTLEWLGSWLDLVFDPSWSEAKRREVVREAVSLYRKRGTPAALSRWLEIYTGQAPTLLEEFQLRPAAGAVLGDQALLGATPLSNQRAADLDREESRAIAAHRFRAYVSAVDARTAAELEPVVRKILDAEKPAHTDYTLEFVLPDARIGEQSRIGIDFVLGHGLSCGPVLGADAEPEPPGRPHGPVLGRDVLARGPSSFQPLLLDLDGAPIDPTLRLE